ncbi:hypothetical protein Btru_034361 [Bulinus truncatus]|nr:hypothetical protein Btru_034361 [Bulinus truncatus]
MAPKDSSDCVVTVTIELGHQAHFLREPSPEGFTHDWTVFVRGQEGSRLEAFVEKVVFRLHKTFKCPLRTISEPPYKVSESGYAGFLLPIEIHFKNKQSPRKIVFSYDLFLNAKDSPPINNVRIEKLKFQNPTPEFKAKLLKAGGIEQGADPVPYTYPDQLSAFIKSDHKKSLKVPKNKEKKKKKKSAPKSPDVSLSSLSSSSSSLSDGEPSLPPPPPPPRKEKDKSSHKKGSSSFTPHSKPEFSSSQTDIDKHKSVSTKERNSLESDYSHKSHKSKSKDKNPEKLNSSHKSREDSKKDKEISHKDREGSHSSAKSSSEKKSSSSSTVHKEKDRSSSKKEKESTSSLHLEKHTSSSREKEKHNSSSHKSKHSSHKDVALSSAEKKTKGEINELKISKDKSYNESKSHKRPQETQQDDNSEKKKLKRSTSVASVEEKHKEKIDSAKDKHNSSHKESKEHDSHKIKKEKDQVPSSSKSKHDKSKLSDKHKQTHSSDSKPKESKDKKSSRKHKDFKLKTDNIHTMTKSEHLAMTADFQPKLLLSPLKDKLSDESNEPSPTGVVEQKKSKRAKSTSSYSSLSSHEYDKSDIDTQELQVDKVKNIISGLTDSDSDSGDDTLNVTKSPPKEHKTPSKPSQAASEGKHLNTKSVSHTSQEKRKISDVENIFQENVKTSTRYDKNLKSDLSAKNETSKVKEQITKTKTGDKQFSEKINSKHFDIFTPNGFPLSELISINEKIEKAHSESNKELLCRVVDIIGNTNDFDLDETSVFFDICSVDKSIVHQIQATLKEY